MKGKIISVLTRNVGLKLVAVVFAIVLWFLVVNVDNPNKSGNFTVPVTIKNENVMTDAGKYVSVLSGGSVVTFRVTAKRSIYDRLSSSDFVAVADLKNLEDNRRVPIEIRAINYSKQVTISSRAHYVEVEISDVMSAKFVIEGATKGEAANGNVPADIKVSPNVVSVEGPADVVSKIDHVVATCDIDGLSSDVNENVVPVYYNAKNKVVDTTQLTMSVTTVSVTVDLVSVMDVNLSVETSGELQEGLTLDSVKADPETIKVQGEADVLNKLTTIVIPGSAVNLSSVTSSMRTTVDISTFLPEGVKLAEGQDSRISVIITLKDLQERTFTVPLSNFTIRNLGSGLAAEFEEEEVEVVVTGYSDELDKLTEAKITGSVDVSGLDEGSHRLRAEIDIDGNLQAESVVLIVVISRDENDEGE